MSVCSCEWNKGAEKARLAPLAASTNTFGGSTPIALRPPNEIPQYFGRLSSLATPSSNPALLVRRRPLRFASHSRLGRFLRLASFAHHPPIPSCCLFPS